MICCFTVKTSLPSVTLQHRHFLFVMVAVLMYRPNQPCSQAFQILHESALVFVRFHQQTAVRLGILRLCCLLYRNDIACFNCKLFQFCSRCTCFNNRRCCFARFNSSSRLFGWHCRWWYCCSWNGSSRFCCTFPVLQLAQLLQLCSNRLTLCLNLSIHKMQAIHILKFRKKEYDF